MLKFIFSIIIIIGAVFGASIRPFLVKNWNKLVNMLEDMVITK